MVHLVGYTWKYVCDARTLGRQIYQRCLQGTDHLKDCYEEQHNTTSGNTCDVVDRADLT